jgi:hypothetical protein
LTSSKRSVPMLPEVNGSSREFREEGGVKVTVEWRRR